MKLEPPEDARFHVKPRGDEEGAICPGSVVEALRAIGVGVDRERAALLAAHARAVLDANRYVNLTAVRDPQRFVTLHIADSLAVIRAIEDAPRGEAVDIGTGAGYPGLPLAISTGRAFTLVEATRKKAAFLREVVRSLDLAGVSVVDDRAETLACERPCAYAVAVARAVGSLATVVELAAPLLHDRGRVVVYKGHPDDDEIRRGDRAAQMCGLRRIDEIGYELPGAGWRTAYVYEKTGEPAIRLPRRAGMAAHRPLG